MSQHMVSSVSPLKPSWIGIAAMILASIAVMARTLVWEGTRPILYMHVGLQLGFSFLYMLVLWKPGLPAWLMHLYLLVQSSLIFWMRYLLPEFDFVAVFFVGLSYQVSLYFCGRLRWAWTTGLAALTAGSLIYHFGIVKGMGLSLTNIAVEFVIPAFIIVSQEIEASRVKSRALIDELQKTNQQLEIYASQAGELAAWQERIRLARELHDSVSQLIFSISLTTRSVQLLLAKDPSRVSEQLLRLKVMTTDALSQLRSMILQLRPPQQS